MKASIRTVVIILCSIFTLLNLTHATFYNKALSITVGGTATATSSTPYATGYEPKWAIDGVLTFCNSELCTGPYFNLMFKSWPAMTSDDVFLRIDMGSIYKIISLYMSLEESDPEQHVGM